MMVYGFLSCLYVLCVVALHFGAYVACPFFCILYILRCSCRIYMIVWSREDLCVFVYYVGIAVFLFNLDAGLLARSQYSEGPATGHLDTGFFLLSLCLRANAEMVPKIPS